MPSNHSPTATRPGGGEMNVGDRVRVTDAQFSRIYQGRVGTLVAIDRGASDEPDYLTHHVALDNGGPVWFTPRELSREESHATA